MVSRDHNPFPFHVNNNKGFSAVALSAITVCVVIVIIAGVLVLKASRRAAYEITAKHDLRLFVEAEEGFSGVN